MRWGPLPLPLPLLLLVAVILQFCAPLASFFDFVRFWFWAPLRRFSILCAEACLSFCGFYFFRKLVRHIILRELEYRQDHCSYTNGIHRLPRISSKSSTNARWRYCLLHLPRWLARGRALHGVAVQINGAPSRVHCVRWFLARVRTITLPKYSRKRLSIALNDKRRSPI